MPTVTRQRSLRAWRILPRGRLLPPAVWERRHRVLTWLLVPQVVVLPLVAQFLGNEPPETAGFFAALAVTAFVALAPRMHREIRAGSTALGHVVAASIVVHLAGGVTEAHFLFFVVIAFLALYQSWTPFLVALVYIVVEHGVVGTLEPRMVYQHADHIDHPWEWAAVHAGFVLLAAIANIGAWREGEDQAQRDALTGLPNRVFVVDTIARLLAARRDVVLMFVDLDDFKATNDAYGHNIGDALLVELAGRIDAVVPPRQLLARMGGDEFAVVLSGRAATENAKDVAQSVLDALRSAPVRADGLEVTVTASVGIAHGGGDTTTPSELLRNADLAMYEAKRAGGGRVVVFEAAMHTAAVQRAALTAELRRALERDELVVHYQPIVDLASGQVVASEALVRWQHPVRGLVPPGEFIPAAEESGLIVDLGAWVLRAACRQNALWQNEIPGQSRLCVSVNLAPRQLADPTVVDVVRDTLDDVGLRPESLWLEITEGSLIQDFAATLPRLTALRAAGPSLSLDDFGTGYSSLSYLRRLPVQTVKIDRSFVKDLTADDSDVHIVTAVVNLAHALGMTVTAEGAETLAQVDALRRIGVDRVQGYAFGRPMTAESLGALLWDGGVLVASQAPSEAAAAGGGVPSPRDGATADRHQARAL